MGNVQIDLENLAAYERDYQLSLLDKATPIKVNWISPSESTIVAAVNSRPFQGRYLREWYSSISENLKSKVRDTVRMGITEGRTTSQIVRDIRGTRSQGYKDGVLEIGRRNAEAVIRTAVTHTAARARERVAERNSRYIKGMQVLATLDNRTSVKCRAADGAVIVMDGYKRSDFPDGTNFLADVPSFTNDSRPPFHVNCRTSLTYVLRDISDFGIDIDETPRDTRASMNGQVSAGQDYGEWLRKQPAAFQDEVLGEQKGALFRRGGLDMDDFLRRDGSEMTLDELQKSESAAWEKTFGE